MDCPKDYVENNDMERESANNILSKYIEKMNWKQDEVILDVGCGSGDVTFDIVYVCSKNIIKQLVGVHISKEMVDYANKKYGSSKINVKVLDIGNTNDCNFYSNGFDKIFSSFCLHWVNNKLDAFINLHLMLKSDGEILIDFLLIKSATELYKSMNVEWKKYIDYVTMDCPTMYVGNNDIQRKSNNDIINKYIEKMIWKQDEVILDIGCGPGDVTSEILYASLKDNTKQLIGVDKSKEMIEYANKTYGSSIINFKVLDIENTIDCNFYSNGFDKIFSFFCLHWVNNKIDVLINVHLMLKSGGEILFDFLLVDTIIEIFKSMDAEWTTYIDKIKRNSLITLTHDEIKTMFIEVGFRIISIESNPRKYTFPDLSSFLNAMRPVDAMLNVLPSHLHNKYFMHFKDKMCEKSLMEICPTTGKTTLTYHSITVHAIKE